VGAKDGVVIVAIDDYAFLPDVRGARSTAADWRSYFEVGLGVTKVFTLLDQQATVEEMRDLAGRAARAAEPSARLWWVFVGHGAPSESSDDGVMVGVDGQQTVRSLSARGLPQAELLALLETGGQAETIVVIDACFSGRTSDGSLAPDTQPAIPVVAPKLSGRTVILSAAKSDQIAGSLPGTSRPAFSYLLLGALRGWGDIDGDGDVTAGEAHSFAKRSLMRVKGRLQTPEIHGPAETVLAPSHGEGDPGLASLIDSGGRVASALPTKSDPEKLEDRSRTDSSISPNVGSTSNGATLVELTGRDDADEFEFGVPKGFTRQKPLERLGKAVVLTRGDGGLIEVRKPNVPESQFGTYFESYVNGLEKAGFRLLGRSDSHEIGLYRGGFFLHELVSGDVSISAFHFLTEHDGRLWVFYGAFPFKRSSHDERTFTAFIESVRFGAD
jgi:hypothetical protein